MPMNFVLIFLAFVTVTGAVLVFVRRADRNSHHRDRVKGLMSPEAAPQAHRDGLSEFFFSTLPRIGATLVPQQQGEDAKKSQVRTLLVQAGFYKEDHLKVFLGVKAVLMFVAPVAFLVGAAFQLWA